MASLDNDLIRIGYFLASGQRIRQKGSRLVRSFSGNRRFIQAEIVPDATYGFPVTSDQDKYLAFHKIVRERLVRHGEICNPISFQASDLLKVLQRSRSSGRHHARVREWIQVIAGTSIILRESFPHSGADKLGTIELRVFDYATLQSRSRDSGAASDKHHVWLSNWQLANLKRNHALRIDLDTYLDLRHVIAKALLPHLHIWLYASRHKNHFEKRCKDLCRLLGLPFYAYRSQYYDKLGPALKELRQCGYLGGWAFEHGRMGLKIVLRAGDRFCGLLRSEQFEKARCTDSSFQSIAGLQPRELLLAAMRRRGILQQVACRILEDPSSSGNLMAQLQWGDYLLRRRSGISNPAGFYVHLIQSNATPPADFITSCLKKLNADSTQARHLETQQHAQTSFNCDWKQERTLDEYITSNMTEAQYQSLIEEKRQELLMRCKRAHHWTTETTNRCLESAVREEIARALITGEKISDTIQ